MHFRILRIKIYDSKNNAELMSFLGFQKFTDQHQNVSFMISLPNKMFCMWIELGMVFANGHNSMSSLFFSFFCYGGSSLKIHKTYLNNLHCLNSLGTIVKVKKTTVIQAAEGICWKTTTKKRALLELLALNSRLCVCMYLHFNVGLYLSSLCWWFPILRRLIDSGIICCLIKSEPFPLQSVEKEPLVFSMLASH